MYKLTHSSAAELIQELREKLHGYLIRQTHCPETASDILQDAFLRLIHADSKNGLKNPPAFLYRIVSKVIGGYAYMLFAKILKDSVGAGTEGKRLYNVPVNNSNLWTSYTFQNQQLMQCLLLSCRLFGSQHSQLTLLTQQLG